MEIQRSSAAACALISLVEIMRTSWTAPSLVAVGIASAAGAVASVRPVWAIGGVDFSWSARIGGRERGGGEIGS